MEVFDNKKKLWFASKRYGYGWTPATWEGWLTLALYLLAVWVAYEVTHMGASVDSEDAIVLYRFLPMVAGLTIILLTICVVKGEKPRWRWGK